MKSHQEPTWFRLNCWFGRTPKLERIRVQKPHGFEAAFMWVEALGYATATLSDGFIPDTWPASNGYRTAAVALLLRHQLWYEVTDLGIGGTPDPSAYGFLINDFEAYQVSRATWTETGRKRREASAKAHAARWGSGSDDGRPP